MDYATLASVWGPWAALAVFIVVNKWDSIMALIRRRQTIVENGVKAERTFDQRARNGLIESTERNWEQQEWQRGQLEQAWQRIVLQADSAIARAESTERMIGSLINAIKTTADISQSQGIRIAEAIKGQTEAQEAQTAVIVETNKFLAANWFALANLQKHMGHDINDVVRGAEEQTIGTK